MVEIGVSGSSGTASSSVSPSAASCAASSRAEFFIIKAYDADVKILLLQSRQLGPEKIVVPTCVQCELIVREDVSALLCVGEVVEDDDGHFGSSCNFRAASRRPCPAMMPALVSTRIGLLNPNSAMLAAICATCASECVLGFRA